MSTPICYGKQWDPKDKECAGGLDPAYKDENGSHLRSKCDFYSSCGVRFQSSKINQVPQASPSNFVPTQNLTRNIQSPERLEPPAPRFVYVDAAGKPINAPQPQVVNYSLSAGVQVQQPQAPPPQMQYQTQPQQVAQVQYQQVPPMQQQVMLPQVPQPLPVDYRMPYYLTVPEVRGEDEGIGPVICRTLLRGGLKGIAQSLAHLIDTTPFKK